MYTYSMLQTARGGAIQRFQILTTWLIHLSKGNKGIFLHNWEFKFQVLAHLNIGQKSNNNVWAGYINLAKAQNKMAHLKSRVFSCD